MTFANKLKNLVISGALFLVLGGAAAPAASAQGWPNPFGAQWLKVGSVVYPGGTWQLRLPIPAPIETSQVGVVVPQFCAPRAASSRAVVTYDDGFGERQRLADLRFIAQDTQAGQIRARFRVVLPFGDGSGFESTLDEIRFTFVPVAQRSQACRLDFYVLLN